MTSRQLREREWSIDWPVRLRASIGGRRVCFPGISTARNDWTVRGDFSVADLVGNLVFVVGDDGRVDSKGELHRVSAVMASESRRPAPPSFLLVECASVEQVVDASKSASFAACLARSRSPPTCLVFRRRRRRWLLLLKRKWIADVFGFHVGSKLAEQGTFTKLLSAPTPFWSWSAFGCMPYSRPEVLP